MSIIEVYMINTEVYMITTEVYMSITDSALTAKQFLQA